MITASQINFIISIKHLPITLYGDRKLSQLISSSFFKNTTAHRLDDSECKSSSYSNNMFTFSSRYTSPTLFSFNFQFHNTVPKMLDELTKQMEMLQTANTTKFAQSSDNKKMVAVSQMLLNRQTEFETWLKINCPKFNVTHYLSHITKLFNPWYCRGDGGKHRIR